VLSSLYTRTHTFLIGVGGVAEYDSALWGVTGRPLVDTGCQSSSLAVRNRDASFRSMLRRLHQNGLDSVVGTPSTATINVFDIPAHLMESQCCWLGSDLASGSEEMTRTRQEGIVGGPFRGFRSGKGNTRIVEYQRGNSIGYLAQC